MTNTVKVHKNIKIFGRRTSVRLEPEFWSALEDIAKMEKCSIHELASFISRIKKDDRPLASALRVFVIIYYREAATQHGHDKAGHGNYFEDIGKDIYMKKRQEAINYDDHEDC